MESRNFDELTRMLARGASRRTVLRGLLVGGAAATGIAAVRAETSLAAPPCRDEGEVCEGEGNTCCSGRCDESQQPAKCVGSGGGGDDDGPGQGPGCRSAGEKCQDNPGQGNNCCSGLICNDPDPGVGVCVQPATTPPPTGTTARPTNGGTTTAPGSGVTSIDTLPSTGSGPDEGRVDAVVGITLAGGAALIASRLLRRGETKPTSDS